MRIRTAFATAALAVAGALTTAGGAVADDLDVNYTQDVDVPLPSGSCSVFHPQGGLTGVLGLPGQPSTVGFTTSCNSGG
ncbi:hypothetical protein ACFU7Y_38650 [Kitasatospora sp. NPDC057542]|uniref:hypothetical protein n=1 Tax=Kitasatospora sp. NPDC057542 TaxID=3346162 RepID=UPI00367884C0